jgi:hypothetical protein
MAQWSSNETWNNGITRTIKPEEGADPNDARFVAKQLDGEFNILGNGIAEFNGKGRLYVFKKDEQAALEKKEEFLWEPNIEVSCDIKVDSIVSSSDDDEKNKKNKKRQKVFINVGGCTNHFAPHNGDKNVTNSNGRNYSIRAYFNKGQMGYEKETIHGIYDFEEAEDYPQDKMPLSKWFTYKFRQKVVNDGKYVQLEGWIKEEEDDEKSFGSYTDKGKMTDLQKDKDKRDIKKVLDNDDRGALYKKMSKLSQVWTVGAYSGLYIRLTGTKKGAIRNLMVKEI